VLERKYLTYAETAQRLGYDEETFRQFVLMRDELRAYIELFKEYLVFDWPEESPKALVGENRTVRGQRDGISWRVASEIELKMSFPSLVNWDGPVVVMTGWVPIEHATKSDIVRVGENHENVTIVGTPFVPDADESSFYLFPPLSRAEDNTAQGNQVFDRNSRFPIKVRRDQLWFSSADVDAYVAQIPALQSSPDDADRPSTDASNRRFVPVAADELAKHKPDWAYWRNFSLLTLDDAIVLSCDVDPIWHASRKDVTLVRERKTIASSHIASGNLHLTAPLTPTEYLGFHLISAADFRRWAQSLPIPFEFPAEFPTADDPGSSSTQRPPSGPAAELDARERTTLLCVIGALAESAGIDLSKHNKAGEVVSAMLDKRGIDISGRAIGEHLRKVAAALQSRSSK